MPKASTCKLNGRIIGVEEALQIRDKAQGRRPYPPFSCRECDELVRPHK